MKIAVCGAGGFIGGHLTKRLVEKGHRVHAYDIQPIDQWHQVHQAVNHDEWDLRAPFAADMATRGVEVVYDLAADMGGMGFISGHKLECMNSVLISAHLLQSAQRYHVSRFFYASSACVYPDYRQGKPDLEPLKESDAYPAMPEDGYGWEKLFSERLARHYGEETAMETRIARLHNVYGPHGTWNGGREKAPAALCRKVALAKLTRATEIEIWGDGQQTRTFCWVDDAVDGIVALTASDFTEPLNIGSTELVSIDDLLTLIESIAGVKLARRYDTSAPQGVRGRSSDNTLVREVLDWEPSTPLADGMERTYAWIEDQVRAQ